jgi:hypothetical protein
MLRLHPSVPMLGYKVLLNMISRSRKGFLDWKQRDFGSETMIWLDFMDVIECNNHGSRFDD